MHSGGFAPERRPTLPGKGPGLEEKRREEKRREEKRRERNKRREERRREDKRREDKKREEKRKEKENSPKPYKTKQIVGECATRQMQGPIQTVVLSGCHL